MAAYISGRSAVVAEMCEALGLKHVKRLNLSADADRIVRIAVEFYPEENDIRALTAIIKKYNLKVAE